MVLATRRTASMKVRLLATLIAVFAFVVQPYVGLAFNHVANALNSDSITLTPSTLVVAGGQTGTSTGDAASYSDLSLTFHYTITNLESTDSLQYGWRTSGGVDQQLGSLDGQTNANGHPGADEVGSKTVSLPSDADIDGLTLYFKNNGDAIKPNLDTVTIANLTLQGQKATTPIVPETVNPIENTRTHETFTSIQAALADSDTRDNDTIALNADVTTTDFIRITRPITLNGNGHTITASNTVTSSVIDAWYTSGVTISNLTIDGNNVNIRGINVVGADAALNDVTVENNGKDGVVVNASRVTVTNITTSGNAWDGVDVDKAGAVLTVNGTSTHTETGNAIYLDDTTTGAKVIDTNNQYFISHPNKENKNPNDRAYNLDRSNLVVNAMSPTNNAVVRTPNYKLVVTGTFTATENGANYLQAQLVYNGNSKGIVTTYGAVTNGTLAEFDTTGLPEGSGYYIALTGTDTLGNVSERQIINFTIDNTKPVAAFMSDTLNPTPNGYYNSDFQVGYSATDNVQLKGINISLRDAHDTTSGNQWRANCYDNQSETTNSDIGTCMVKLPANLPDGEYFIQIGVQDAAGNWSTVATRNVRIQRTVPAQPAGLKVRYQNDSTYLSDGDTLWQAAKPNGNNLELTWNDKSGDWVDGHDIKVTYPDGSKDSFHQGSNTNSWLIYDNFGKKGNGQYVYSVVADNPNGSSVPSDTFTLYYDTQSPTASFTSTVPQYANGDFKVTGIADDNVRLSGAFFDVRDSKGYVAGCEAGTFTINYNSDHTHADLSCVINTSKLVNGQTYTVRIHDGDMTGHYGGGEDQQVVFNTDAPVQPQGLQAKFQYDGTNVANNSYLNISAKPNGNNLELTWNQPTDWVAGYHILATYPNDATIHVGYQGPNANAWLIYNGFGQYGNGAYTYQVEAVNPNGSTVSSEKFTLNFDNTNPVVDPITVTDAKGKTKDANSANLRGAVTFHGSQTETNPNRLYVEYDQKGGSGKWQKLANTGWVYDKNTADLSVDTTKWTDGEYQVKVSTDDKAWNHGGETATFTVDNTPASLSFISPTDFSKPFAVGPNVTVKASDTTSGLGVFVIHVYDSSNNAAKFCTASAAELAAGELSCDLSTLPSGTYHILAGVNDNAGNNTTVKSGDFIIDTERPDATITTPSNNGVIQGNFTISGTATDNQTSVDHVNVYITKFNADGSRAGYVVDNQATQYDTATKTFTYPVSGLVDGTYTIKAVAFDQAGNSHFASTVGITVDNTPPTLTVNASNGTQVTGTTSNATDAVTVDGEAASVEKVANQNGSYNWSFTPTQSYKVGTTTIAVVSTDAAGNARKETAQVVVVPANTQQSAVKTSAPNGTATLANATTSGVQSLAVTPNNDSSTIAPTDSSDSAVLGTQTKKNTKNPTSNAAVLGTNSVKAGTWTIFGLAWYWWLLILAILAGIIAWIVAAARRASDNSL